ncbi:MULTISPECIES: hypothetical protein [unclassified Rhizobium]|uniref:hypothetical protein n=1 Tax=unclassified Rhizobium TaxID=2613769 RepID=UPI001ADD0C06|nr:MULTISPECIES: hypothetical protein [unclassified Rhizobium]MBO9100007.1 hypothetical protein [Rhizobium sp. L58/93]QXZ82818.1 hypothetical protein J5287_12080 [Rhizobium sp. K1/93]QXZ89669.1 hypothetical protein J5280_16510 [Rhizobium sp. K15/93]
MTSLYTTGTVTLTNGSALVVGTDTAWAVSLISGGTIYVQGAGNPMPIASVDGDTQITSALEWIGATGVYEYALMRDTAYGEQTVVNANALTELLNGLRQGTVFKYDVAGTDRSIYDSKSKGFAFLDIGSVPARLYIKKSDATGDWAGPFSYAQGETGPPPNLSIGTVTQLATGVPATAEVDGPGPNYLLNLGLPAGAQGDKGWTATLQLVADGPRSVFRVSAYVGGAGELPTGVGLFVGSTGLVANIADAVDVRGMIGLQGPRGTLWRGAWVSTTAYNVSDLVTDNDAIGNPATWIAIDVSTNLRPRDNLSKWAFFPGSFPALLDDGIWGDAVTETNDDGVWGA